MKEPKLFLNDPWLGKREIGSGYLPLIKDQLRLLVHYRDDGRIPSEELLSDIKVYEYIIQHPQAETKASEYMKMASDMREEQKTISIRKIEVAKRLGWFE